MTDGINPDGIGRIKEALATFADALRGQCEVMGHAFVTALADGISVPPLAERARAYQHARMVAALTCPWAALGPASRTELWLGSIVQEAATDG